MQRRYDDVDRRVDDQLNTDVGQDRDAGNVTAFVSPEDAELDSFWLIGESI